MNETNHMDALTIQTLADLRAKLARLEKSKNRSFAPHSHMGTLRAQITALETGAKQVCGFRTVAIV